MKAEGWLAAIYYRLAAKIFILDRLGEGNVGVRQGRIEGQVNGRLTAAVPVAVPHPGRKDDERAGRAFVLLTLDLNAHYATQDVEDLIDVVDVHAGRGATASGRLNAIDRAGLGTRGVIEQILGQSLVGAALIDGREINPANVFHGILLSTSPLI